MPKKQNKQDPINEAATPVAGTTEIQKAIAAAPRAKAPVSTAPVKKSNIKEEDPKDETNSELTAADDGTVTGDQVSAGPDDDQQPITTDSGTECPPCEGDGAKDGDEAEDEAEGEKGEAEEGEGQEEPGEGQEEDEVKVDVEEDVQALISGDSSLTEDFKAKAKTIFEAAVKNRVRQARKELHEGYQKKLSARAEEILSTVTEQVDNYLSYVVDHWIKENQVAVDSTLRTEIAEGFITSLKNVFAESYIEVPKADKDLVESMNARIVQLQEQVKQANQLAESSQKQNEKLVRRAVITEASKGLAMTQASRLAELAKDVTFESAEAFTKKVATIKESYFSGKGAQTVKAGSTVVNSSVKLQKVVSSDAKVIVEGQEDPTATLSPDMKNYVHAISRVERGNPNRK